jgi:hypothetical protein
MLQRTVHSKLVLDRKNKRETIEREYNAKLVAEFFVSCDERSSRILGRARGKYFIRTQYLYDFEPP